MIDKIRGITFSHKGNFRSNNEDAVHWGPLDSDAYEQETIGRANPRMTPFLAAVADGVGGCAAGEEASRIAIETIKEELAETTRTQNWQPLEKLADAMGKAHSQIVATFKGDPSKDGMATTFTGILFAKSEAYLMHIGDSRCYRYTSGTLTQESVDHSPVGKLVAEGRITEEEALIHPHRSYIDRVLGNTDKPIEPAIETIPLKRGDRWLLCTDGLSDSLYPGQIEALFSRHSLDTIEVLAVALMDAALDAAGRDNVSLTLVEIGQPTPWQRFRQSIKRKLSWKEASKPPGKPPTSNIEPSSSGSRRANRKSSTHFPRTFSTESPHKWKSQLRLETSPNSQNN